MLQMARKKNALTIYEVAKIVEGPAEPEYMRLAKWISTVNDDSDESIETVAYYDGDGTPEDDVENISEKYGFEGTYDYSDPGQNFIASLKREIGEGRKIMFRKTESNGDVAEGRATVTDIIYSGGEASDYGAFSCSIAWDRRPEITKAGEVPVDPEG